MLTVRFCIMEISTMHIHTHWRCSAILSVGKWTQHGGSEVLQLQLLKSHADEKMVILRKAQAFGIHKKLMNKSLMLKVVYRTSNFEINCRLESAMGHTYVSESNLTLSYPYAYLASFTDPTQLSITCSYCKWQKVGQGPGNIYLQLITHTHLRNC